MPSKVVEMAVVAISPNHLDQAAYLNNLRSLLGQRFEQTRTIDDINHAVEVADTALAVIPLSHPSRATILDNFGN